MNSMQFFLFLLLEKCVSAYYYRSINQDINFGQRRNDRSLENYDFKPGNFEDQYHYEPQQEYVYPTSSFDWQADEKYPIKRENSSQHDMQRRNDNRFGFYNVQTGDEFFLNDFDVRPKFKTKEDDRDVFEFEYFGYTTQATPILYSNSLNPNGNYNGNRKVGQNRKPTRKPIVNTTRRPTNVKYNTNKNKNKQTMNKKRPNISTTRRPVRNQNQNKRKPVIPNKQTNRKPSTITKNNCNGNKKPTRSTNQKKPMVTKQKRPFTAIKNQKKKQNNRVKKVTKPNTSLDQIYSATPQTLVINNVVRRYIERMQAKTKNRKNDQSFGTRETFTRKIFNMPTFEDIKNSTMSLTNKFLSLFTVVQFENFQCVANSDTGQYIGTCYHESHCGKLGGFSAGDCANGYGVCCVVRRTCGESSSQNLTYFESINYPNYFPYPNLNITSVDSNTQQEEEFPQDFPNTPNKIPQNPTVDVDFDIPTLIPATEDHFPEDELNFSSGDVDFDPDSSELPEIITEIDEYDTTTPETTESSDEVDNIVPNPRYKYHRYQEYKLSRQDNMADSLACIFWVYKTSPEIQQMRIDFIDVELIGPNQNGDCLDERFVVSGQNINAAIPVICGYNSGHHYYVDVSALSGPLQISILSTSTTNKRYKFLVSQLATPCSNSYNCLQYFTGISGTISSFNYDDGSRSNPQYMNNLNYAICIRRESGYCSITYETGGNLFEITNRINGVDDLEGQSMGFDRCLQDYIVIDNMRICGGQLTSPITDSSPGPIVIPVRSDSQTTGRGFKLNYIQNKCTAISM